MIIPIIIPTYEPDKRLIQLLKELKRNQLGPIIIVNDGSGSKYDRIFEEVKKLSDSYLKHGENRGKGAALKTAFNYVLQNYPKSVGVITVDSDGQHSIECIKKIIKQLKKMPTALILGTRDFHKDNSPKKSYLGNKCTSHLLYLLTGRKLKDTQTGLRGIPLSFVKDCLNLPGNRFEFEMQMLKLGLKKIEIIELPIKTIYDSLQKHQTHFRVLADSLKIYKELLKFSLSSISSFFVDIGLFSLFFHIFKDCNLNIRITIATFLSRSISLLYNYALNYKFVFCNHISVFKSVTKYIFLAVIQMNLSALFVIILNNFLLSISTICLKIFVDTMLFLISYIIQKRYIFNSNNDRSFLMK